MGRRAPIGTKEQREIRLLTEQNTGTRRCSTCGVTYPLTNFYSNPPSAGGRLRQCKSCVILVKKTRQYSVDARRLLEGTQRCEICFSTESLCIDHDHETKLVRGVLCNDCNLGLGRFHDNIKKLTKAIEYLKAKR